MSYIAPSSTIKLYKDVPLDTTYDHTIWFKTRASQTSYFNALVGTKTYENQYYTRVKKGVIRIAEQADNIYDYNYLSFKNPITYVSQQHPIPASGKTFYCFITYVEYINNNVTEVGFEIDPMQTWLVGIDYTLGQSFVEREHAATDVIGDNIIDEGLDLGPMVYSDCTYANENATNKIIVAATFDDQYNEVTGDLYGGVYSGLKLNKFDTPNQVNNFINGAGAKINGIVSIFYAPSNVVTNPNTPMLESAFYISAVYGNFGSYTPVNNKLYTYPYNYLYVTNFQTKSAIYKYEFFHDVVGNSLKFLLCGAYDCNPVMVLAPYNYNGQNGYNFTEMLTLSGWPQCAFNVDIYKAWLAQSKAALPYEIAGTALSAFGGIASAGINYGIQNASVPLGIDQPVSGASLGVSVVQGVERALVSAGTVVLNHLGQKASMQELAKEPRGGSAGNTMFALNKIDFGFYNVRVREEYAKIIDEYFSMYGYACHRVKVPNIHVRARWTYTKTVGCKIHGSMPADIEDTICKIFDHGITFWRNGDDIGKYHLANGIDLT